MWNTIDYSTVARVLGPKIVETLIIIIIRISFRRPIYLRLSMRMVNEKKSVYIVKDVYILEFCQLILRDGWSRQIILSHK